MSAPNPALAPLLAELDRLRGLADASFAKVLAEHPAEMACKKGCDDCCHALFDVSPLEALALALGFARLGRAERRAVARRAQKAAAIFDQVTGTSFAEQGPKRLETLSQARIPCPLLEKGACLLYQQRPLTCRLYGLPVKAGGQTHTCGRSGFQTGVTYPTADYDSVANQLMGLSQKACHALPKLPPMRLDVARAIGLEISI